MYRDEGDDVFKGFPKISISLILAPDRRTIVFALDVLSRRYLF